MSYNTKYIKNEENKIKKLSEDCSHIDKLPNLSFIKNGIILPRKSDGKDIPYQGIGGVLDSNGEFVQESVIYDLREKKNIDKLAFGGKYNPQKIVESDKNVIYLGLAHKHWGHFLIDIIQRCWYPMCCGLLNDPLNVSSKYICNNLINNKKDLYYAFCGFGDKDVIFDGNYKRFFELLGLDTDRIIYVNKPTRFRNIIVPDVAIYPGLYVTDVYKQLFDIVVENVMNNYSGVSYDNVYFSRTKLKDKKDVGEKYIEEIFRKVGCKILYPETMTLDEQIFCWQTTKNIFCINGSITHNSVFSSNNVNLYVLNKMSRIVGYQFTMDLVNEVYPTYVKAYKEPFNYFPISVSRGPFWIYITDEIAQLFKDLFDIKIVRKRIYIRVFFEYLLNCIIAFIKYKLRGKKAKIKRKINIIFK